MYLRYCKKSPLNENNIALKGSVLIIDDNNQPNFNYTGINISSENPGVASINLDKNGQFDFPTLPNNSTSLILNFSKTGYGTVKQYYTKSLLDSFKNGLNQLNQPNDIVLNRKNSVSVNSISGVLDSNKFKMFFNVSVNQTKPNNGVSIFLLKDNPEVSYNSWTGDITNSRHWTIPVTAGDNQFSICLKQTVDCDCDFLKSGDTVYLKAYGDTYSLFGSSYNYLQTNQGKFPCINSTGSSNTISFIVP